MTKAARLMGNLPQEEPQTWVLEGETTIIGRHPSAGIPLPLLAISRQHAQITNTPQGYFIEDLGSRNGTFVNGEPVGEVPQPLSAGDEIVLGGEVVLHFEDPLETINGKMLGRMEGVWINPQTVAVWVDAKEVEPPLSPAQHALLSILYEAEGNVVSRADIIGHVWQDVDPEGVSKDAVNGLIKRLRAKLRNAQPEKEYIEVLRGHGLRLVRGKAT
ncbi:MAG: Oxoglutarate dehydrogenase inhibitor [Chloroflexi bacterium]|nr:Oxoglutarate dehydrogenase inhibitor [Chloroflexota bacterium]